MSCPFLIKYTCLLLLYPYRCVSVNPGCGLDLFPCQDRVFRFSLNFTVEMNPSVSSSPVVSESSTNTSYWVDFLFRRGYQAAHLPGGHPTTYAELRGGDQVQPRTPPQSLDQGISAVILALEEDCLSVCWLAGKDLEFWKNKGKLLTHLQDLLLPWRGTVEEVQEFIGRLNFLFKCKLGVHYNPVTRCIPFLSTTIWIDESGFSLPYTVSPAVSSTCFPPPTP